MAPAPLRLRVEPPVAAGFEYTCARETVVVGRSKEADLVVGDDRVSRRHLRFLAQGDAWFVEDLGARNGTLLNGRRLDAREAVRPGDVLRLGSTSLEVSGGHTDTGPSPEKERAVGSTLAVFRPAADVARGLESAEVTLSTERSIERYAARLQLLNEVHRALAGPVALAELLELILDRAFAVLGPEEGVILLKQPTGELASAASRRPPEAARDLVVSRHLVEEVVGKGSAALVSDAGRDERFSGAESSVSSETRGILAAPLADATGCVGMIVLYSRAHVRRFVESDLELLVTLASAAALRIRAIALAEDAAARRLLDRELTLAHDIQMGLQPPRLPERPEVEIAAALLPARSVGGDLYDACVDDAGRLWFIVGDAAGEGIGAALFVAVARSLFRAVVDDRASLAGVLGRMNRELARESDRAMFVTVFAGCLDLATGRLEVCNAGHSPPYLLRRDGSVAALQSERGIALGVEGDLACPTSRLALEAGDTLVLYTDGVTESAGERGGRFTSARLEGCLARLASSAPAGIVRGVLDEVRAFSGTAPQQDDLTLLVVRYAGTPRRGG